VAVAAAIQETAEVAAVAATQKITTEAAAAEVAGNLLPNLKQNTGHHGILL
jgi:hypothetical protein